MCSLTTEGDIEDLTDSLGTKISKGKKIGLPENCNKCPEKPSVILRNKDAYCKSCFLSSTLHKFKALLGKHKLIKNGNRVLISYRGGHPSTALKNFLQTGLDLPTPKKLRFSPVYFFIEHQHFLSKDDRMDNMRRIQDDFRVSNIPIYFTLWESYSGTEDLYLTENPEELFDRKFTYDHNIFSGTSLANDFKEIYIRKLLIVAAKILDCQFIFTPELSVDIASSILSKVVMGRGTHIPLDSGFCDDRDEEVTILRPLRTFDIKEISLYNYYNNLDPILITDQSRKPMSAQTVIEKFVNQLQSNYSATVTTILKTGDKLGKIPKRDNSRTCYICKGPLEISSQILTSEEAIQFSHKVSTQSEQFQAVALEENGQLSKPACFSCSKFGSLSTNCQSILK